LIGDDRVSANPKLNNCIKGWDAACNEYIVLADSNALPPPDYLQTMLASFRKDTGLVVSMPIGSRPKGSGRTLNALSSTLSKPAGNMARRPSASALRRAKT
jgi:ceramide glucosyltransferase